MITTILADHRHFHSSWQIDNAITAKSGGTLYGCYRQATREVHKRWRGLRDLYSQRRKIGQQTDLDSDEIRLQEVELEHVIRDTEREFLRFVGQALACRRALGLADDQELPEDRRETLEAEFWAHQIKAMAAVDFITSGRLGRNTVELLVAIRGDQRRTLAAEILDEQAHAKLVEWYLTHEPEMPEPVALIGVSTAKVLECVSATLCELPSSGITEAVPCSQDAITGPG